MTAKIEHKPTDFRLYLQETLVDRCKTNPKYSLRAFARRLDVEPSFLSKVLSGKRAVTKHLIERLADKLELDPTDKVTFINNIKKSAKNISPENNPTKTDITFEQLTLDSFKMISDWYHYAILELVSVDGFENSNRWIATALGITPSETAAAVERLIRLEMLMIDDNGKLVCTSANNTTLGNEFTAVAFRKLQKQILEHAKTALEDVSLEHRDQTSMTMAISSSLLPEAKKMLKDFRRKFCADLQDRKLPRDQVYEFSLSFFPVTKLQNSKGVLK